MFHCRVVMKVVIFFIVASKIFEILSAALLSSFIRKSHKKIISVHRDVIATNLESCLSHKVDILREFQFWVDIVILGTECVNGEAAQRP